MCDKRYSDPAIPQPGFLFERVWQVWKRGQEGVNKRGTTERQGTGRRHRPECQRGLGTGKAAGGAWLRASALSPHSPAGNPRERSPRNCSLASWCHLSATQGPGGESALRGVGDPADLLCSLLSLPLTAAPEVELRSSPPLAAKL